MKRFLRLGLTALLVGAFGAACLQPTQQQTTTETPAPKLVRFADSEMLSGYLRGDAETGPLVSAHRGGPTPGFPENCLATFENTLKNGPAVLECDVQLTRDGNLVLMHDDTLNRTTTGRGRVSDETLEGIRIVRLRDNQGNRTPYSVPTLAEALAWSEGRAILTLDIKRGIPPQLVVDAVKKAGAGNRVTIIVYNLEDLLAYHKLDPSLNIAGSARNAQDVAAILNSGVPTKRLTVFTGVGRLNAPVVAELGKRGIRTIMGTFGELDEKAASDPTVYTNLVSQGIGMIATDRPDLAFKALAGARREPELQRP